MLAGIVLSVLVAIVAGKPAHPALVMAALCVLGGGIGFARTGSKPSLVAGVSVGILYALAGYRISNGASYGIEGAAAASVLLLASSAPRFAKGPLPKTLTISSVLTGSYYLKQLLP